MLYFGKEDVLSTLSTESMEIAEREQLANLWSGERARTAADPRVKPMRRRRTGARKATSSRDCTSAGCACTASPFDVGKRGRGSCVEAGAVCQVGWRINDAVTANLRPRRLRRFRA